MIQREERSHLIGGRLRDQERIYGRANFFRGTLMRYREEVINKNKQQRDRYGSVWGHVQGINLVGVWV